MRGPCARPHCDRPPPPRLGAAAGPPRRGATATLLGHAAKENRAPQNENAVWRKRTKFNDRAAPPHPKTAGGKETPDSSIWHIIADLTSPCIEERGEARPIFCFYLNHVFSRDTLGGLFFFAEK